MPVTYTVCDAVTFQQMKSILKKFHPELSEVKIGILFAHAARNKKGFKIGPAVKLNGYPCAAVVRIRNLKDRTAGAPDAEIVIDKDEWNAKSDTTHDALLDHELEHLEPKCSKKTGMPLFDDLGRPLLKMRKHNHQFGWFDAIANRHGDASYEITQAKAFADKNGQTYFGWAKPPGGDTLESITKAGVETLSKPTASDNATKGVAVKAAKEQLRDQIATLLKLADVEATEPNSFALAKEICGGDPKTSMKTATLGQIQAWIGVAEKLMPEFVKNICRSSAEAA